MTDLEKAAINWFTKRKAFLDFEEGGTSPQFREYLNACADGEHSLADECRKYLKSSEISDTDAQP